jgi:divalent metal cation (Fe/Co/Zn/Cd) transporter
MKGLAISVVIILVVSLALWSMFEVMEMPLDPQETSVVVGVVAIAVIGTRWLLAARRAGAKPREDGR